MYNFLLCDDEQIVIDSIKFILLKNFEGQINIFTAQSGAEALNIVSREQIDIIFMDINMPGMTGLETINCILNLKPETVIMILSAFDSFQYAQEAINLGAFKYITKPVNRNVVVQNVRSAMNAVDTRRSRKNDDSELQKKLELVSPMIESDFFYSCIFNKNINDETLTYLDYFNIQESDFFLCVLEFTQISPENHGPTYSKIREYLHQHYKCLVSSLMSNRMIVLIPVQGETSDSSEEEMKTLSSDIFKMLSLNVSRNLKIGISEVFCDLNEMNIYYNQALKVLLSISENGIEWAKNKSESDGNQENKKIENPKKIMERLFIRLKIGDSTGVSFLLNMLNAAYSEQNSNLDIIKGELFQIVVNANNFVREINPAFEDKDFGLIFAGLSECKSSESAINFIQKKLETYCSFISSLSGKKENLTIRKVLDYIKENLSGEISLENAAAKAGVNPFYLSKLFREETGSTFVNYIADLRMEKAKELLSGTNLSIKEISAQTGYNDQNYFSKLFRNKFGISPSDFRNS